MAIKPITPAQAKASKTFPDNVIDCWNAVIIEKLSGGSALVEQDYILNRLVASTDVPRAKVIENGWLDVEDVYRKAGWKVNYDKPGYDKSYKATFSFVGK